MINENQLITTKFINLPANTCKYAIAGGLKMEKIIRTTFSIPDELKKRFDARPEVNWPEIFRQGLEKKLKALKKLRARGEI